MTTGVAGPVPRWTMSSGEAAALASWCAGVESAGTDPGDGTAYADGVRRRLSALPTTLTRVVTVFASRLGRGGAVLVQGLPVPKELPPTPTVASDGVATGREAVLVAVGLLVGEPLSFFVRAPGCNQVQNLYPRGGGPDHAAALAPLELHTELAFDPKAPDALALLCLRAGTTPVPNRLSDLASAAGGLTDADRRLLPQAHFGLPAPGGTAPAAPRPLVTPWKDTWRYCYTETVVARGVRHVGALRHLGQSLRAHAVEVVLRPGDLLLVDNLHMAHGRAAQQPLYDGSDRWLQRVLVRALPRQTRGSGAGGAARIGAR